MIIAFSKKIPTQKYPNKVFLVPNFFTKFCTKDKFEGADFKYDNIIFKSQPQNTQIRDFGSKFKNSNFYTMISNMKIVFKLILSQCEGSD